MGRFQSLLPLYETTSEMTVIAAASDKRFTPVTQEELKDLKIEVSALSPLKKISNTQ